MERRRSVAVNTHGDRYNSLTPTERRRYNKWNERIDKLSAGFARPSIKAPNLAGVFRCRRRCLPWLRGIRGRRDDGGARLQCLSAPALTRALPSGVLSLSARRERP